MGTSSLHNFNFLKPIDTQRSQNNKYDIKITIICCPIMYTGCCNKQIKPTIYSQPLRFRMDICKRVPAIDILGPS